MPARHFDGRDLRRMRRAAERTQADVADALGVRRPTVAKWESGETFPEAERLSALAATLGGTLDELFPRDGEPDLADLRCDAGYPQNRTGEIIGTKSHIPVSNAERGVRRLDPGYVPKLAQAYGVSEALLLAAQDRSFGELTPALGQRGQSAQARTPTPHTPTPQTLAEKIRYLLERTFSPAERPSDEAIAAAVNARAGRYVLGEAQVRALRTGEPPAPQVLAELPESLVYEGLSEVFGVSPLFFQSNEQVERQVVEGIQLMVHGTGLALAARGDQGGGLSAQAMAKINELVAALRRGKIPDAGSE
ncbi:transcriptional regulator with XRE-family HTH domain [Kitasatospora sp. MAP12-15]|uniref:helix-turn-helix transcriptional regulator n=1 Tax=unclassified Kitasatospora TaxID=2633591 RepID=UPI0024772142|nr:helix-turn-helix transcriptional regulator [Kitasatospora sp. MAP12-44]MDH6109507.1 transcriptional regulator with XRE-family HTH domain [Kitasatospora sp. MAP12-44]